jgi:UDP-4-amino-4,6-dideoxy-N-acetyl-beta-L-altrosamine transaminase
VIPYARQQVSQEDIDAVVEVLRSEFLTQGPVVPRFESAVAAAAGAAHAVAVNSATSALHLACLALGVGPGDLVWTSAITFVASANCARHCGAELGFIDIDARTGNLSVERLAEQLAGAARAGRLPKVVIPVHLGGQPCDMAAIHELATRHGFRVIEDAAHALGGTYRSDPVGCGRYSDITVFSFHAVKVVTTGEGGVAVTNDPRLAARMRRLRSHGITREPSEMTVPPDGPWFYQQLELGFNYRITDLQAALGVSQLRRLGAFVARRRELAERYDRLVGDLPVAPLRQHPDSASAWHLYIVRLLAARAGRSRREVFDALRAAGVGVNVHYIPVYRQPAYATMSLGGGPWPEADRYYAEALTLPLHAGLSDAQQDAVVEALRRALESPS